MDVSKANCHDCSQLGYTLRDFCPALHFPLLLQCFLTVCCHCCSYFFPLTFYTVNNASSHCAFHRTLHCPPGYLCPRASSLSVAGDIRGLTEHQPVARGGYTASLSGPGARCLPGGEAGRARAGPSWLGWLSVRGCSSRAWRENKGFGY